jgi:hypothetical protein
MYHRGLNEYLSLGVYPASHSERLMASRSAEGTTSGEGKQGNIARIIWRVVLGVICNHIAFWSTRLESVEGCQSTSSCHAGPWLAWKGSSRYEETLGFRGLRGAFEYIEAFRGMPGSPGQTSYHPEIRNFPSILQIQKSPLTCFEFNKYDAVTSRSWRCYLGLRNMLGRDPCRSNEKLIKRKHIIMY